MGSPRSGCSGPLWGAEVANVYMEQLLGIPVGRLGFEELCSFQTFPNEVTESLPHKLPSFLPAAP